MLRKKSLLMIAVFVLSLFCSPQVFAHSTNCITVSVPVINFETPHKVDCSVNTHKNVHKTEVDVRRVSLKEQTKSPRSAVAHRSSVWAKVKDGLKGLIEKIARSFKLEPRLLEAVALAESGGNQAAVSPKGAVGVMQLMPETARALGVNPYDVRENIIGGAVYLKMQLERFGGNIPLALAAYNAGPGAVEKYKGIPPYPETRTFVARVLSYLVR